MEAKLFIFYFILCFLTKFTQSACFTGTLPSNCEIISNGSETKMCELKCSSVSTECLCEKDSCCTLTQGGWENSEKGCKDHPIDCNTMLCNRTFIEILEDNSIKENAWLMLAHQWVTSILNINVNNACTIKIVNETMNIANISLFNNCDNQFVSINSYEGLQMREQAIILDQFNNGNLGVKHC